MCLLFWDEVNDGLTGWLAWQAEVLPLGWVFALALGWVVSLCADDGWR